ncbi:MAG: hypothetical protein IPM12_15200 [Flavobacteriales bacterium]|nr:hypothetical protein [Flavobacteriales bacterium]
MIAEASFSGTARLILVLLTIWLVVRWYMRRQQAARRGDRADGRKPGDVRIENASPSRSGEGPPGRIVDADFEEIK